MINAEVLIFLGACFPLDHSRVERNETKSSCRMKYFAFSQQHGSVRYSGLGLGLNLVPNFKNVTYLIIN